MRCISWWSSWTVKHEIKKQEGGFPGTLLAPLPASLVEPVIYFVVKDICGKGVGRAGKRYMKRTFYSSAPSFEQYRHY